MRIGLLALQGAFREHRHHFEKLGAEVAEVRLPGDLHGLDGLVLPGGESTTMARLMGEYDLWQPVRAFHDRGGVVWGTCAGAILLAREVQGAPPQFGGRQESLKLLNVAVKRNAFGRQIDSFTCSLTVKGFSDSFPAVFIRAPAFLELGPDVQELAAWNGQAVMVQQGRILATAFHPELTPDERVHQCFLQMLREGKGNNKITI